ncbi:MAG: GatB/YqeY domain-containing protein [Deltaproteobacteria bacterium]|nr:MAG: GatB/YqeY domain-containing protein [Deltaproteobacteria bacterium]
MSLEKKIGNDLKDAMRAKDSFRLSCLRMLKSSIKNKQVEIGRELKDEEIQKVISSLVRKSKEAAGEFRAGGREDLATKEEAEAKLLYGYLPEQLTHDKMEEIVREVISELGAEDLKDLGRVMKAAMARMAGRAEGKEVNQIVRQILGG